MADNDQLVLNLARERAFIWVEMVDNQLVNIVDSQLISILIAVPS